MEQVDLEPAEGAGDMPKEGTVPPLIPPTSRSEWEALTPTQELSEPQPEVQCSYSKKGKCKLHNQIGNKTVRKRSVWVKKKFGYGWVTKQVTEYHCNQSTGSKMPELSSQ